MGSALLLILFQLGIFVHQCQTLSERVHCNSARYDNYRLYRVEIDTVKHVQIFQEVEKQGDSYVFYGVPRNPGQKITIVVAAHKIAEMTDILKTYKVKHTILAYNFQEKINRQLKDVMPKDTPPEKFDWNHYFHLETINAWMEKMASEYEYVTMIDMGQSFECLPIKGVKLAKHQGNTGIFIESGIHAREWIAPATATYILNELLTSTDPAVQKAASEFNWFIFPVVNPDGYRYTFESDRMWRKNRNLFGICRGVDLNRNFPYHWNETGSSSDPCRNEFAGIGPASEPETQAIIKFIKDNVNCQNIKTYFALHSFSQLVMYPYGSDEEAKNHEDLHEIALKAVQAIRDVTGKEYKCGTVRKTAYLAVGLSKDWAHKTAKIPITYTFELRGPMNSTDLFILPAEEIHDTGKEIMTALLTILEESQKMGYYN